MRRKKIPRLDANVSDWSGVHSDDRIPVWTANNRVLAHYGLPELTVEAWLLHVKGQSNAPGSLRALGVPGTDEQIQSFYRDVYIAVTKGGLKPSPYHDSSQMLRRAKELGIPNGIVSSHPAILLEAEAVEYGIRDQIDHIFGDAYGKAAEIVLLAERLGIGEERMVFSFTGDMINDILAARLAEKLARKRGHKLRVVAIAITTGYHDREHLESAKPDCTVDSLTQWEQLFFKQLSLFV